jgi:DNA-binding winged helix-turn-helix (wHTH) protein
VTNRLLYRDGQLVRLPPKVFDTLLFLVANSGRVVAKEEMMKQIWPDTFVEEGTVNQYISHLRKALGDSAKWIENHPRRGYRFTVPVEEIAENVQELRIEEHTRSRTVIGEETVTDQGRISLFRIIAAAVGVLALATAAFVWISRREDTPQVFQFRGSPSLPNGYRRRTGLPCGWYHGGPDH